MTKPSAKSRKAVSPISIGISSDENYAVGLVVTLRSMVEHLHDPRPVEVFVLDGGLTAATQQKLRASVETEQVKITFLKPDPTRVKSLPSHDYINFATYFRILASDLLPKRVEKVLYLDADLLVMRNVAEMWDIELGDKAMAATQSSRCPWFSAFPALFTFYDLDYRFDTPYMDVGVALINCKYWRENKLAEKLIRWVEGNRERIFCCDQDAMNALLVGKWLPLEWYWNVEFPSKDTQRIIHFLGGLKPWTPRCGHPAKDLFFEYLDRTSWKGWRPKKSPKPITREEVLR